MKDEVIEKFADAVQKLDNHLTDIVGDGDYTDGRFKEIETGQIAFGIGLHASTDWPDSCHGAYRVVEHFQKLLEAAAQGRRRDFQMSVNDIEDAIFDWQTELFGVVDEPPTPEEK